jgi:hypothetical protein
MSCTSLPLVLKNVDTSAFFEIRPNRFIVTSSNETKPTVDQCPDCSYFESPNRHIYKVGLCEKCNAEVSHINQLKNAFK